MANRDGMERFYGENAEREGEKKWWMEVVREGIKGTKNGIEGNGKQRLCKEDKKMKWYEKVGC